MARQKVPRSLSSQQTRLPSDISLFSFLHINEIPSAEWIICFPPFFHFSLEPSVTVRKDRQPLSLDIPPHHHLHHHHHCWCKALKFGIPTMLSLRETANPPTVEPRAASQTGQALGWRDNSCSPRCVMQAKEHQQAREVGGAKAVHQVQRWAPLVYLSRGRTGRWGGWGWGRETQHWEQEDTV